MFRRNGELVDDEVHSHSVGAISPSPDPKIQLAVSCFSRMAVQCWNEISSGIVPFSKNSSIKRLYPRRPSPLAAHAPPCATPFSSSGISLSLPTPSRAKLIGVRFHAYQVHHAAQKLSRPIGNSSGITSSKILCERLEDFSDRALTATIRRGVQNSASDCSQPHGP